MTAILPDSLASVRTLVEPGLRRAIDKLDPRIRLVSGYHLGFWSADGVPSDGGGKGLRAAFALLSARAAGADPGAGEPAAVAIELVHNYSLLHDDVMDRDVERRHRPTAWTVYGEADAILAGDGLLGLAFEVLAEAPRSGAVLRSLGVAVRALVAGQTADLGFERRTDVGLTECLAMARDKTAALFACACSTGALLCGAPESLTRPLTRYGDELGLAFQLVDDLLGIWGAPAVTGKPVLSDLRSRKKSIPVVYALESDTAAGRALRVLYHGTGEMTDDGAVTAAELIEATGAREWTEREAGRRLDAALAALDGADVASPAVHAELAALACFVTGRQH